MNETQLIFAVVVFGSLWVGLNFLAVKRAYNSGNKGRFTATVIGLLALNVFIVIFILMALWIL